MCGKEKERWYDREWQNELWAAQITAAARVKLHKLLLMQGSAAVYCDTDSVFSTQPIVGLGEGLGALTMECVYETSWIVGPKMYRLEPWNGTTIAKAKGIPRDLAEAFLKGDQVYFDRPITPHEMVRGKGNASAWYTLSRERRLVPYRRQPVSPELLEQEWGASETRPPAFGVG
jgi:hypothetical protein